MPRLCRVAGCCSPASSRYSIYCHTHRTRFRRHGAVDQEAVTKADLKPYRRLVEARIERNRESPLWDQLDARWVALSDHARSLLGPTGTIFRYERQAAHELLKLDSAVSSREVVLTTLAMFLMQELEPRRFMSDRAFRTQLVRRVRGLTDLNAGSWFDHRTNKTKRAYRDVSPRATAVLGQWLAEALGGAGLYLARLEQSEIQKKQAEINSVHEALAKLN